MSNEKQTLSKWSADEIDWFVLACKTYEERRVAKSLQSLCDIESAGGYFVFVPTKDYAHQKTVTTMRRVPWLNGYVFIATTESAENCARMVDSLMVNDKAIFKLLSYDGSKATPLTEDDKRLFVIILDEDFHIPALKADVVDGRVKIAKNLIESNGGKVVKVDKRKRSALVEMFILGERLNYEVALELTYDRKISDKMLNEAGYIMEDITIKARTALEREISFTPDESLAFLQERKNFRSVPNGIKKELMRLGFSGSDDELLKAFRGLMGDKGLLSSEGRCEGEWFRDIAIPNKESSIKLCFAFGLSSKTKPTALEFLWNVCKINGLNYRVANDIVYHYALERGLSFFDAQEIISAYEAKSAPIVATGGDETKGTSTIWETFKNIANMDISAFNEILLENKKNFIGYNRTSRAAFIETYNELSILIADEIKESNENAIIAGLSGYSTGSKREAEVHAEIVYDGFLRSLVSDGLYSKVKGTVVSNILENFPLQKHMDWMRSGAKKNLNKATDLGQGFARKTFILCFFAKYVLKWKKRENMVGGTITPSFYHDFYDSLELLLFKCSYGLLYPANPFDWLILNSARSLDSANPMEDKDALELFNEVLALLCQDIAISK